MRLEGWGRHPVVDAEERLGEDLAGLTDGAVLSRGLGRSYGDASLPLDGPAVGTRLADRILAFDPASGLLRAEAGLSLHALSWIFWPRGFTSPVLPGTAYITLGGMVAADVHAKNHHVDGTIGRHVQRLRLRLADGRTLWCSREHEPALFCATLGGMGLTGHLLEVELILRRIPSAWVWQESERFPDLGSFLEGLDAAAASWPFTMGWIDCLKRGPGMGRGILYRGRWAEAAEAPARPPRPKGRISVPVDVPSGLLNGVTMRAFNVGIYAWHPPWIRRGIVHPESFFQPLDSILRWNRGYGCRGFTQYQCVVPSREGARRVLDLLTRLGVASFLCVLKDCGEEGEGLLSFPRLGTSIAVDVPVRPRTAADIALLNEQVIAEGGRVYLAKDTFTTAAHYRAMDPRVDAFLSVRRRADPGGRLRSVQSRRIFGDD